MSELNLSENTAISHDVLLGIAHLALERVEGVSPVAPPTRVGEILSGRRAKGLEIKQSGKVLVVELSICVTYGYSIPEVARSAQKAVREAVASMTGVEVASVHVTVTSVEPPEELLRGAS